MNTDKYVHKIDELVDDGLLRIILNGSTIIKRKEVNENGNK